MFKSKRKLCLLAIDFGILLSVYAVGIGLIGLIDGYSLKAWGYVCCFMLFALLVLSARVALGIYSSVLRYADSEVYSYMIIADILGGVAALVVSYVLSDHIYIGVWQSVTYVAISCVVTLASRFIYRLYYQEKRATAGKSRKIGVAIVGAGQVGTLLAQELLYNSISPYVPLCFVDKDAAKVGNRILGLPVYSSEGDDERISRLGVREIFISIPKMSAEDLRLLSERYSSKGYKVKLYDFPIREGGVESSERVIRELRIEDLLSRSVIDVADGQTRAYYADRVVLVTGGGGSIGSELCRQIAACGPKKLVVFDIYENNAYDLQQELVRKHGSALDLAVEIGSVRDRRRLEAVFATYRPEIVIHAAAHKHVPLMERSNAEAIKNNVFGTYNTADMAEKYGTERFILISTDKAVNPTNVMGASKRLCEMVIQCRTDSATAFCAVRFGNVLGSNGSVIPLFKRQIAQGGPVTVTDKRIIRYFMTIPEASGLVMQAGAMAQRGELFVLDMGKPVRILDLAENMIRLSGYRPYEDIDIVEVGLRPGEKLYEELLIKTETTEKTTNNLIFREQDTPLSREEIEEKLDYLREVVASTDMSVHSPEITAALMKVVPTFHTPDEINARAEGCEDMKLAKK